MGTERLILGLDQVQWDPRTLDSIVAEIERERPLWLRVANFFDRTLELLRNVRTPQLVLWKLEFWGTDTSYDKVPASPGVDPARFTEEMLALGHRVVPYTFVEWNRPHLIDLAPALGHVGVHVLPLAQKAPVEGPRCAPLPRWCRSEFPATGRRGKGARGRGHGWRRDAGRRVGLGAATRRSSRAGRLGRRRRRWWRDRLRGVPAV